MESRPGSRHRYRFKYWRPEDKRGCLKYSYGVNILLNRAAVFSKDPIDLTYFLHGRIKWYHGFLVEGVTKNGTEGAVTRLHLEKQIQKVKKPIAFISPEFITDPATMSRDVHHFSQFKKEAAWLEFQETVEQFLGTKKRGIARRNLMVHSQSYARVARMKNWKNVRFNSTTLIDTIYGKYKELASIAQNYKNFGSFTSYAVYNHSDKRTYKNNNKVYGYIKRGRAVSHEGITSPQSKGKKPSFISIKQTPKAPDGTKIIHKNATKYVFHQYLIQQGYLTSEEVYGN